MICAIMQPTYFPWIGDFDMIDRVDSYIFYDDVQVVKRNWDVRNKIKSHNGELYLTVPIKKTKSRDLTLFNNAIINDDEKWREKHLKSISFNYRKSVFYEEVFPFITKLIEAKYSILSEFNINIIQSISSKIGIETEFKCSSNIHGLEGKKDERLVNICKKIGANKYLSPQGAAVYIESRQPGGVFPIEGVELFYRNYEHPRYEQLYGDFVEFMSILDLLFNCGFKNSLEIIKKGRKDSYSYLNFRKKINLK